MHGQIYVQHICLITKIIIVFLNHVFLKTMATFTEEIFNGKLHFFCSANGQQDIQSENFVDLIWTSFKCLLKEFAMDWHYHYVENKVLIVLTQYLYFPAIPVLPRDANLLLQPINLGLSVLPTFDAWRNSNVLPKRNNVFKQIDSKWTVDLR